LKNEVKEGKEVKDRTWAAVAFERLPWSLDYPVRLA
jgi:hypothetical protein